MLFKGKLTADAQVSYVTSGKKVTGFTVAIADHIQTKAGEKREIMTYVKCSYWINPSLSVYLSKGVYVEISGQIMAQAWINGEGEEQANVTCTVSSIRLLGSSAGEAERSRMSAAAASTLNETGNDLPY